MRKARFLIFALSGFAVASFAAGYTGIQGSINCEVTDTSESSFDSNERAYGHFLKADASLDAIIVDADAAKEPEKIKSARKNAVNKDSGYNINNATLLYGAGAGNANSSISTDLVFKAGSGATGVIAWWAPQSSYSVTGEYTFNNETNRLVSTYDATNNPNGYINLYSVNSHYESLANTGDYTGCYCFGDWLKADLMSDYVYARAYSYDAASGFTYSSTVLKYSVLNYCYNMRSDAVIDDDGTDHRTQNDKYIDKIKEVGAKAQEESGHNPTRSVESVYHKVTVNNGKLSDGFSTGLFNDNEEISLNKDIEWWKKESDGDTVKTVLQHNYRNISTQDLAQSDYVINCQTGDYTRGLTVVDGVLTGVPTDIDNLVIPDFVKSISNEVIETKNYERISIPSTIAITSFQVKFSAAHNVYLDYGDNHYYYDNSSYGWNVLKIGGTDESVEIPYQLFGIDVKNIDKYAIENQNLKTLIIHESSMNCSTEYLTGTNVTTFKILDNLALSSTYYIQYNISSENASLVHFSLNYVDGNSYTIPEKLGNVPVTSIGASAFLNAYTYSEKSLTELKIPTTITSIGNCGLDFTSKPDNTPVTVIYEGTFVDWTNLAKFDSLADKGTNSYYIKSATYSIMHTASQTLWCPGKVKCSDKETCSFQYRVKSSSSSTGRGQGGGSNN